MTATAAHEFAQGPQKAYCVHSFLFSIRAWQWGSRGTVEKLKMASLRLAHLCVRTKNGWSVVCISISMHAYIRWKHAGVCCETCLPS